MKRAPQILFFAAVAAVCALLLRRAVDYYWQCDDAFISYRYARNFADGLGLVFNRGERVEGYTNLLWVLELAALWKAFGVRPEVGSVALSGLCTAVLLAVTAAHAARTPFVEPAANNGDEPRGSEGPLASRLAITGGRTASRIAIAASLLLLATNRNVAVWATSGLETRQFTAFVVLAVWLLGEYAAKPWRLWLASLALTGAALTRPEGLLIFAACAGWYVIDSLVARRLRVRDALRLIAPFTVIVAGQFLFRHFYYGSWFPNTYYAKHVRAWTESGNHYLFAAALENGLFLLGPLAVVGAAVRWARRRDSVHFLSLAIMVPHLYYVRHIGGDHFEFRPLDFYWPLLSVAAVDALLGGVYLVQRPAQAAASEAPTSAPGCSLAAALTAIRRFTARWAPRASWRAAVLPWAGFAALLAVLVEYATVLQRAHDDLTRDRTTRALAYKLFAEVTRENTPWAFRLPLMGRWIGKYNRASWYCVDHQSCTRQREHQVYWRLLIDEFGPYQAFDAMSPDTLPDDAVWVREAVGIAPYYVRRVTVIDLFGLTDAVIARTPVDRPNAERTMAHDRHPPPGYLDSRGVNIDIGPAVASQGQALHRAYWALRLRDDLWMPFLSPDLGWVTRSFQGRPLFSQFHFDPVHVNDNTGWAFGRRIVGARFLGRFDGDPLDGWTHLRGAPVNPGPVSKSLGLVGDGLLTTRDAARGDEATMLLESPEFVAKGVLVFLMGGGDEAEDAGVALIADGALAKVWKGRGVPHLELVTLDLTPYVGQRLRLQVFDESKATHIAIDHVFLAEMLAGSQSQ
jgi:arabinofuranosyltransferase